MMVTKTGLVTKKSVGIAVAAVAGFGAVGYAVRETVLGPRTAEIALQTPEATTAAQGPSDAPEPVAEALSSPAAEAESPAEDAPEPDAPSVTPPAFDVVRVDPDGTAVVAGTAEPGSSVQLFLNGDLFESTGAGPEGKFAMFVLIEPSEQPLVLTLLTTIEGQDVWSDDQIVLAPLQAPVEQPPAEAPADAPQVAEADQAVDDAPSDPAPSEPEIPADGVLVETTPTEADVAAQSAAPETEPEETEPEETEPEETAPPTETVAALEPAAEPVVADEPVTADEPVAVEEPIAADVPSASDPQVSDAPPVSAAMAEAPAESAAPLTQAAPNRPTQEPSAPEIAAAIPPAPTASQPSAAPRADQLPAPLPQKSDEPVTAAVPDDPVAQPAAPEVEADAPIVAAELSPEPKPAPSAAAPEAEQTSAPQPDKTPTPEISDVPSAPAAPVEEPSDFASAPAAATATSGFTVIRAGSDGVELIQPSNPTRPEALERLALDTISYSEAGEVQLSGRAPEGAAVRVYLNNRAVADLPIDKEGRWKGELADVRPGVYTLRLDQVSQDGKVGGRLETPFKREAPSVLEAARADLPPDGPEVSIVTVQRGDTLWAISRKKYGSGLLYVRVFEANREAIRNPDLIYPGQIFNVPN